MSCFSWAALSLVLSFSNTLRRKGFKRGHELTSVYYDAFKSNLCESMQPYCRVRNAHTAQSSLKVSCEHRCTVSSQLFVQCVLYSGKGVVPDHVTRSDKNYRDSGKEAGSQLKKKHLASKKNFDQVVVTLTGRSSYSGKRMCFCTQVAHKSQVRPVCLRAAFYLATSVGCPSKQNKTYQYR